MSATKAKTNSFFNREYRVTEWQSDCWVKPDWIQQEPCKSAVEPVTADLGEYLYEDQPELLKYR